MTISEQIETEKAWFYWREKSNMLDDRDKAVRAIIDRLAVAEEEIISLRKQLATATGCICGENHCPEGK